MVSAILAGELADADFTVDPIFGLAIPTKVEGVPTEILVPRQTWADEAAYDAMATKLAGMFRNNFTKFESGVSDAVKAAGPK
jgi:phosphoenolpyruvate carboxykinase (ATP)